VGAQSGRFVISLDFELYWGIRHMPWAAHYMPNLVGARKAIPDLLAMFSRYATHATWATVGFLFFENTPSLLKMIPQVRPEYRDKRFSPYLALPPQDAFETPDSVFFGASLIRAIAATPDQEVATHTFSHYYCLEEGQHLQAFRADLDAARAAARVFGLELRSLVFPQNQCRPDFLQACWEAGIIAYRGNPQLWLYRAASEEDQGYVRRLGRLMDAYMPVNRWGCQPPPAADTGRPINVVATQFLRPYSPRFRSLEPLRLRRIKAQMTAAAKEGLMYHLWWHPHNFGVHTEHNLAFVKEILEHYRILHERYGFESRNMYEIAAEALGSSLQSREPDRSNGFPEARA